MKNLSYVVRSLAVVLVSATCLSPCLAGPQKKPVRPPPKGAVEAIRIAADAAKKKDFPAVRQLMIDKFSWSFGGDSDADQAIEEWKKERRYLVALEQVLRRGCRAADAAHVECPGRGGLKFRAGFLKTAKGWKLEYFVEGD
jgi:hypothetical protein